MADPTAAVRDEPAAPARQVGIGDLGASLPGGAVRRRRAEGVAARLRTAGLQLATVAVVVGIWHLWTTVLVGADTLAARFNPVDGFRALWELSTGGQAWPHVRASVYRLGTGLGAAAAVGVPLGLLLGIVALAERASALLVQFLRMVSPLAWAPIAVALFGVGDRPVQFIVAVTAIWPITLSTAAGVRALDSRLVLVARSLGATRREVLATVIVPGVRQHVLTGLRLALGVSWIVLVPAEMLGVQSGLGFAVLNARDRLAYDELIAVVLLVGLIGFLLDAMARRLLRERR
jgi:NitT/TauT family transport system permease protein